MAALRTCRVLTAEGTVVCERCAEMDEAFPSVQGTLALEHLRGTIECARGHQVRVERDGR